MHHIAKALPIGRRDLHAKATSANAVAEPATAEPIRQSALRRLWARMAAIYGCRWVSSFGDAPEDAQGALTVVGDTWRRGLIGLEEAQVGTGIEACIASSDPWPPTLPEFRALCLGVPSFAAAVRMIRQPSAERSPFAVLMWQHIDGWQFGQSSTSEAERMLRGAYEMAREHVMRGGALPEPAAAIEAPKPKEHRPASDEVARAAMDKIASAISVSGAWAHPAPAIDTTPNLAAVEAELAAHYGARNVA